jgi:alpha-tubulin suppressor-like RCC1 family protein
VSDGHVKCWGSNTYGQLGNGTTTSSATPVLVNGISNAIKVSTLLTHTCAVLNDGTVNCWGTNADGELGNGKSSNGSLNPPNPNPVQFLGVSNAVDVVVGSLYTCVLLADHTVKCVGLRRFGTLGDGIDDTSIIYSVTPVQVVGISNAIAIGANPNYACALLSDKTIKCWGRPLNGEFPTGSSGSSTPVIIPNVSNAITLSVGSYNICYLVGDGTAYCWGTQNGAQTPTGSYGMVAYQQISLFGTEIAIGSTHGCGVYSRPALTPDSVAFCWGSNDSGQLGDGTTTTSTGVVVPGITDAIDVEVGANGSTCAIQRSGTMKCWGKLTGNSGSPTSSSPVTPDGF